jgi:hypothetical protein
MPHLAFEALKLKYELTTPDQIKQRILWENMKMVIKRVYDSPDTWKGLQHYEDQWKILERIESETKKESTP